MWNRGSKSAVVRWWPNAFDQRVPCGRFKNHHTDQIPGCLCCFCETRSLSSTIQPVQKLVRDLWVRSTDHLESISQTCPTNGLPHAHGTAQTKTSQREKRCGDFSKLPPSIGPNQLRGCLTGVAPRKLFNNGRADHSQLVARSGRSTMQKQQPSGLSVSHRRNALQEGLVLCSTSLQMGGTEIGVANGVPKILKTCWCDGMPEPIHTVARGFSTRAILSKTSHTTGLMPTLFHTLVLPG